MTTIKKLFEVEEKNILDDKYSHKVDVPQYLPKNSKPHIAELYDTEKYSKLVYAINKADLDEDIKHFLLLAATRHIVFRYDKIADYYAHASKEVQELMEQSALVIIDFNDAILNGYVSLCKSVSALIKSGEIHNEK